MKRIESTLQNLKDTFSIENLPIGTIDCMEKIEICTPEATMSQKMISDVNMGIFHPSRNLQITGPIYINGISVGDTIIVNIHTIHLKNSGRSWFGPWIGLLKDEVSSAYLEEFHIENDFVLTHNGFSVKTRPMIGTIGVAPIKTKSTLYSGDYGGNMDIPTLTIGSRLYLKSQTDGALLSLGDVHASMGYGEVLGTGIEIGSVITISVEKCYKEFPISLPIHETQDSFEIIKSHRFLQFAMKDAVINAINFVQFFNKCTFEEAYVIIGEFCDLVLTQVVNPAKSVLVRIPKTILKK